MKNLVDLTSFCRKKRRLHKAYRLFFHDKPELLDKILTAHPETEFVYLQLNYFDWNNPLINAEENYNVARKHNVPVFIMEPLKGGSLIKGSSILQKLDLKK